jgi:hypothetical protein
MNLNFFFILFCLAIIAVMSVFVSCEDDLSCPTGGKCYISSDGFTVRNMCGKSKCAVSRQGAKNVSCDCS